MDHNIKLSIQKDVSMVVRQNGSSSFPVGSELPSSIDLDLLLDDVTPHLLHGAHIAMRLDLDHIHTRARRKGEEKEGGGREKQGRDKECQSN